MSKKHKKDFRVLNYIEHSLVAISTFGLIICVITAGMKKYMSIIKRKWKKRDRIVLLAKSKLNSIGVVISKALIDSNISHEEFVLINNILKEFYDMNEETENSNDK